MIDISIICVSIVSIYVATVPNRNSPPAISLRESYREDGKVKTRTLTNLTHWSPEKIDKLRDVLSNKPIKVNFDESFRNYP